ncbi:MAG TPA: hypothetical protein VFF21_02745 [Flavobacteriaceae bacterium]|nr:hypothetical protein [Flavobacteriaceae bacterium]
METPKNKNPKVPPIGNERKAREDRIDYELDQTFPASDPPSYSKPGNDYRKTKKH